MRILLSIPSAVVLTLISSSVYSAELTDVLDAFDEDIYGGVVVKDPYDFHIEAFFKQTFKRLKITREANCAGGADDRCDDADSIVFNKELRYERTINEMDLEFRAAIYKDLEFHLTLPIIISDQAKLKYAQNDGGSCRFGVMDELPKCVDDTNSTVDPSDDRITADVGDGEEYNTYRYFDVPSRESDDWFEGPERSGLGSITLGIDWAPVNDQRYFSPEEPEWYQNSGFATIVLGMDYSAPIGDVKEGDNDATNEGLHKLEWRVAASKRFEFLEPYTQFKFNLSLPATDTLFKDYEGGQNRVQPGPGGDIIIGMQVYPWESYTEEFQQWFSIDLRGHFSFVGEGREYGPLFEGLSSGNACNGLAATDLAIDGANSECAWIGEKWANAGLDDITRVDPHSGNTDPTHPFQEDGITNYEGYGIFGVQLGLYVQPIQYVQVRTHFAFDHEQEHFITFAKAGEDVRGRTPGTDIPSNNVSKDGTVSFDDVRERNPVYNPTYDAVGRRFRAEETTVFTWDIGVAVQF